MAATQPPTSPTLPATTPAATPPATNSFDDSMLVDEDAEGEDQLIDDLMPDPVSSGPDHLPSTRSTPAPQHPSSEHGKAPAQKRRRVPESPPQVLLEKSAKKREQREREKEQQKYLLNKLIEIFGRWQPAYLNYRSPPHPRRGGRRDLCRSARPEKVSVGRTPCPAHQNQLVLRWLARAMSPKNEARGPYRCFDWPLPVVPQAKACHGSPDQQGCSKGPPKATRCVLSSLLFGISAGRMTVGLT